MNRITVFDGEQYGAGWPPDDAAGAMRWFAAKLAEIPAEYMDSARIEFGTTNSYGCDYARIEIYYDRPFTPEELAALEVAEANQRLRKEREELAQLERLRLKYGK